MDATGERDELWARAVDALLIDPLPGAVELRRLVLCQGLVVSRAQLRELGIPDRVVRSRVRRGHWTVPRRGVVSPLPRSIAAGCRELAASAARLSRPATVISHGSAAAVLGLPLLDAPTRPTLTAGRASSTLSVEGVRVHVAGLTRGEVGRWFGAELTRAARTVCDLARDGGVAAGLVAADASLKRGLTTSRELMRTAALQCGWPGSVAARRVAGLADAGGESPLESLTRLCLHDAGLPPPRLQAWVPASGHHYRVDMLWPEQRVVVESDGLLKYRDDPRALIEEKLRQERLERAGYRIVRVLWADVLRSPDEVVARVQAALAGR